MKLGAAAELSADKTVGFVTIAELGKAQQATFRLSKMLSLVELLKYLGKLGYDTVTITIENDMPVIIGGKTAGIAIAPTLEVE